jgi:hypothetical protein
MPVGETKSKMEQGRNDARRIAASVAKLPDLLSRPRR